MTQIQWTWSERKNAINKQKHQLPFEVAQLVFEDPLHVTDTDPHDDEERWQTFGKVRGIMILVIHTEPMPVGEGNVLQGRIISARKALSHERALVERAIYGS